MFLNPKWWVYRAPAGEAEGGGDGGDAGGGKDDDKGSGGGTAADGGGAAGGDDGAGKGGEGDGAGGKWPDTWRQEIAAGNEKELKRLERFDSPAAVFRSLRSLEQRLSSGELRSSLPKDAKPEEIAKWRAENGIPESPEKYDLKFDSGLVIGDNDKPFVDAFLKVAHENNLTPNQVKAAVQYHFDAVKQQEEALAEKDATYEQEGEDTLRQEWGKEFRSNINRIHALLDTAPQGLKDLVLGGRLAGGVPLASHPDMLRWLIDIANQVNPVGTLVAAGGGDMASSVDDEITSLKALMGNKNSKYWKGPEAEKLQKRYRDLLSARDRLQKRA